MSIEALKSQMPEWAKDVKLNLGAIATTPDLTPQQIWGAALGAALATREPTTIAAIAADAKANLDPKAFDAAKAAAAIMGMNNVYYRFVHLIEVPEYGQMPARLRMNVMANPGVDKLDFELWSLAISAVNGCGMCMTSHEAAVLKLGATRATVQNVVRIASIVASVATVIAGESALAGSAA